MLLEHCDFTILNLSSNQIPKSTLQYAWWYILGWLVLIKVFATDQWSWLKGNFYFFLFSACWSWCFLSGCRPQWRGAVQSVPGAVKNLCLDWADQLTGTQGPQKPRTVECQKAGGGGEVKRRERGGSTSNAHVRTDWEVLSECRSIYPTALTKQEISK